MSGEEGGEKVPMVTPVNKRLLGKTMQVAQRRGSFYHNLKIQQQELPPPINNQDSSSGKRVFRALHGRTYNGIQIQDPETVLDNYIKENDYQTPVFIDGEGNFYNLYYQKLNPEKLELDKFPDPENSVSYTNFEQNVAQWYNKTQQVFNTLQLPHILGRAYYRPKIGVVGLHNSVDLSEKLEKGEAGSLLSQNNLNNNLEDADIFDIEYDKRWNLDRDIWQTMLFPPEPVPDLFKTFEAYEESLKNWAYICSKIIPLLPPHPSQLQDLLLLKTGEQRKKATELQRGKIKTTEQKVGSIDSYQSSKIFTGVFLPTPLSKDQKAHQISIKKSVDLSFSSSLLPPDADDQTINKCSNLFGNLSDIRIESMDYNGYYSSPIYANIRQIFPHNPMFFESAIIQSQGVKLSSKLPLFRVDHQALSGKILYQHQFDLANFEFTNEYTKEFSYAFFAHFYRQFNVEKVANARCILLEMERKFQLDQLCSWYHSFPPSANITSSEFCEKYSNQSIKLYLEIFLTNYPDALLDLFEEPYASGDNFLTMLISNLNNHQLLQILHYLFLLHRENAKANVALFFYQVMQTSASSSLITFITDTNDLLSLYLLCYCMNYYSSKAIDIFPLNQQLLETIKFEDESKSGLLTLILKQYYLHLMKNVFEYHSFLFTNLIDQFNSNYDGNLESIISGFQLNNGFLQQLFKLINHRSHSISHFALVLMLFLIEIPSAHEYILSNNSNFLNTARALFTSKFSHTKFAAKRIFEVIYRNDKFKEALLDLYNDNFIFLADLTSTVNGAPSELSNYTMGICKELDIVIQKGVSHRTMDLYPFFFTAGREKANFFLLLNQIFRDKDCNSSANINVSLAMAQLMRSYRKLRLLEVKEEAESNTLLYIIADDVVNIVSHIFDSSSTTDISYQIKTNLLNCASEMMTMPAIFKALSDHKLFMTKLLKYCRDGESLQFNKAAWRLFYIMIKYHAGSPALLENGKHLNQFFELISPTLSTVAITNSFFYFAKILNLYENENAKFQNSELKKSVRGSTAEDLKIIEKDIKAFNSVFVKHCVRVHLIYKKLLFNHISGSAFLSIIQFYYTVNSHKSDQNTGNNKIYKELTKNKDYKLQVEQIVALFGAFPPEKSQGLFTSAPMAKRGTISIKLNK